MLEREPKSDSASQRNGGGNHTAGRKKKAIRKRSLFIDPLSAISRKGVQAEIMMSN
jgi:hypothetical protein